jgi:hypothetical protein
MTQTDREWRKSMKDWKTARHLKFISYQLLGRVSGASLLERDPPDLIIMDEAHMCKNVRAAVTRRLARYIKLKPECIIVPMSGSIMKDSIKNFAHLMEWSMGEASCLPRDASTLTEWAEALDEGTNAFTCRSPGALTGLFPVPADVPDAEVARRAFRARCAATAGFVSQDAKDGYGGSMLLTGMEYTVNAATESNFQRLRTAMERPDGWALTESMQAWAVARQLVLGLHYEWDPKPPEEWLNARKLWAQFVRDFLGSPRSTRMGIDSELQTTNAVIAGDVEDEYGLLATWQKIRPTFDINSVPVWHDDSALRLCEEWLSTHDHGICWVEHRHFAKELAKRTGLSYYGAKGLCGDKYIEEANGPIIVSIAANSTGRNLQHKWYQNLVTAPPSDSERWEQLLGRTHRKFQVADTVEVDVLVGCREHIESVPRALTSAELKLNLLGFTQRLKLADLNWPEEKPRPGFRWA